METDVSEFAHRIDCCDPCIDTVCLGCALAEQDLMHTAYLALQSENEKLREVLQEAIDGMGGSYAMWSPKARAVISAPSAILRAPKVSPR